MDTATNNEGFNRLPTGATIGQYRILRHIGSGGMAEVYEAEHVGLAKRVAVKVLRAELAQNPDIRRRFLHEGMVASRIRHPHVVDVTDVGSSDSIAFLVMELLTGDSLETILESRGRLLIPQIIDLLLPILAALGEAHEQGVVHRDVKPDNILLARTRHGRLIPKLVDFGISKLLEISPGKHTIAWSVIGTPEYMSPEQARGEPLIDARSDQFSVAMILYEAATGVLPYRSQSVLGILQEASLADIPRISVLLHDVASDFEAAVMRALSPRAEDRYPLIEDLAEALLPFATDSGRRAYAAASQAVASSLTEPPPSLEGISLTFPAPAAIPSDFRASGLPQHSDDADRATRPPTPSMAAAVSPTSSHERLAASAIPAGVVYPPTQKRRSRWLLIVSATVAGVALLAVALANPLGIFDRPRAAEAEAVAPESSLEPGTRAGPGVDAELAAAAVPTVTDLPSVSDTEAVPDTFPVAIEPTPSNAQVVLDDGEPVGGALRLELPKDGTRHRLMVSAPGYVRRELFFLDVSPPESIVLRRARTRREPTPAPEPTTDMRVEPPPAQDIRLSR